MSHAAPSTEVGTTRRDDPRHYSLAHLPPELAAFETPVEGLGVGRPGKVGLLELDFARCGGATRVVRHFQQFPLHVSRPVYLDPHRPETAFVYVLSHGGVVQGDRYRLDLACQEGASLHVTTQSATKVYRMERNYATQLVMLTAGPESFLEYLPDPIIPFRGARFCGEVELTVHPSATVILAEAVLPGRVAYGEHHDYTLYCSRLTARSFDGELLFCDNLKLMPGRGPPQSAGRFGRFSVLATMIAVTRATPGGTLADRLHARVSAMPGVLAGASELPNKSGAWLRILGVHSADVLAALDAAWNETRLALHGVAAPPRYKT